MTTVPVVVVVATSTVEIETQQGKGEGPDTALAETVSLEASTQIIEEQSTLTDQIFRTMIHIMR